MRNELLVELLKQRHSIRFCYLPPENGRPVFGRCIVDEKLILIDLKKGVIPSRTYLHELVHLFYEDMSETDVIQFERKLWRKLTQYERWIVNRRLFTQDWRDA